jgi:hypothetical protein
MPHQPIQSQGTESSSYNRGNQYYHYSSNTSTPLFPLGQYTDVVYGGGHGMMTPVYNDPRQQLFYSDTSASRQWNAPPSIIGADNDNFNQNNQDDKADNVARDTEERNTSNESDEEAAVTALLMASGPRNENVETMQAAVRMKKQMMHQKHAKQSSGNASVKSRDSTMEESENESVPNIGESNAPSYPSRVVNNFPNVLHDVLTKSEYAGTVLEWLSHGKSWRVLRWDELSDAVIPAYFPDLCVKSKTDDKTLSSPERMNMFIRQIKCWGFKEVREIGPDLGSFQHEVS